MIAQTIIQSALTSKETFDGTKVKFETCTEAIENTAQISGQNKICIAFSKLIIPPLLTANRLKTRSPNLTWRELKKELSMQYCIIPSDTHATQAFTHLEQGMVELLDDYLHHVSELLSKIYHTSEMSRISVEGINHYPVVYGLNHRRLKDSVAGHRSTQWKTVVECFRDICNISMEYE